MEKDSNSRGIGMRHLLRGRIHKRPFVVSIAVLAVILLIGVGLILYFGFFGTNARLDKIRIGAVTSNSPVYGLGLNLPNVPTANIIRNASFESNRYDHMFTVFEGSNDYVYLINEDSEGLSFSDGYFEGGTIRIMSLDEQGKMVQKIEADILDFQVNQMGLWTPMIGIPDAPPISFIESSGKISVAFCEDGRFISDITSSSPRAVGLGIDALLSATSFADGRFCAVFEDWTIATSTDGKNFNAFSSEDEVDSAVHAVTSLENVIVAAGDNGVLLTYSDGVANRISPVSAYDLYTAASDGQAMIFAGEKGEIITSSNGVVFRQLDDEEAPDTNSSFDWTCSAYGAGKFILVASSGYIAIGEYDNSTGKFSFEGNQTTLQTGNVPVAEDVFIDGFGEIILLDDAGRAYIYIEESFAWKELSLESLSPISAIATADNGKIVLSKDTAIYTTSLLTRVQFSETLSDIELRPGDMCFLTYTVSAFSSTSSNSLESNDGSWQIFGDNTSSVITSDAPTSGGNTSLKITAESASGESDAHFVSQVISTDGSKTFFDKKFYRVDVWLKQNGSDNGEVLVWISGEFESVGKTFTDVGNGWRHYSFPFVLPSEACSKESGEMRLNIGFLGKGEISVDKIFLGEDKYSSESIPAEYSELITQANPAYIRLSNLPIGKRNIEFEAYLSPIGNEGTYINSEGNVDTVGCISLEQSLQTVHKSEASPWLLVDSFASQEQIDHLISYLCGSISDPYGRMRIDNGTAVPWSRQFDRIIVEIYDQEGLFETDLQRGAYVDYIMGVIQSSVYYLDIKDKIIFLDGMLYEGGSMLSSADYHSGAVHIDQLLPSQDSTEQLTVEQIIAIGYLDFYDLIPRITSRPQESTGEWISSSGFILRTRKTDDLTTKPSLKIIPASYYVDFLLADLGSHSTMISVDLPVSDVPFDIGSERLLSPNNSDEAEREIVSGNMRTFLGVFGVISENIDGTKASVKIMPPLSSESDEISNTEEFDSSLEGLISYAFTNDERTVLIVANLSDQARQFKIETEFENKNMTVYRFSDKAALLNKTESESGKSRYTLLPGQFMIAKCPLPVAE